MKIFEAFTLLFLLTIARAGSLDRPSGELTTDVLKKVIVVPDVHGDLDALIHVLYSAMGEVDGYDKILDFDFFTTIIHMFLDGREPNVILPLSDRRDVVLIQLGDIVSKGPDSVECVHLIGAVPELIGWPVRILYGNHELMSMFRPAALNRYVHPDDLEFCGPRGGEESEECVSRDSLFMSGKRLEKVFGGSGLVRNGAEAQLSTDDDDEDDDWEGESSDEYSDDSSSSGEFRDGILYQFLTHNSFGMVRLSSPISFRSDDPGRNPATLFVHGGVDMDWITEFVQSDSLADTSPVEAVNEVVDKWMTSLEEGASVHAMMDTRSIVWSRNFSNSPDSPEFCSQLVEPVLEYFNVARIVVGHTPQFTPRAARSRCAGSVLLLDVGISRWVGGGIPQPVVLVMEMGDDGSEVEAMRAVHLREEGWLVQDFLKNEFARDDDPSDYASVD